MPLRPVELVCLHLIGHIAEQGKSANWTRERRGHRDEITIYAGRHIELIQ